MLSASSVVCYCPPHPPPRLKTPKMTMANLQIGRLRNNSTSTVSNFLTLGLPPLVFIVAKLADRAVLVQD